MENIKKINEKIIKEILKDSYDLHTHTNPSAFNRSLDDFDLVKEASEYKMGGVLIKSHYEPTQSRANLVNRKGNFYTKAYGGVVLNLPNGGLNKYAVENALKTGAKIVWMPTRDAKNCLKHGDMPGDFFERPGITVLNERNHLKDEVYDIFQIMKKYDRYLATGHLSKDEIILLCLEGRRLNVKMILTHPEWKRTVIDIETQKYLASLGVLIEKNWLNIAEGDVLAKDMCEGIREIGVENIYLATDRGQKGFERPIYGMMKFIEVLLENGFKKEEIKVMTERNPKLIVGQK